MTTFITTETYYGREEKKFDICGFARAIAQHLDGFEVVTADENTNYPTVWLKKGNARISLRNGYGAKFGKIEFYASHTGSHVLESHERSLGVKDITVDGTRDPAKVAADVKRRLIDHLPAAIAEIDERIAKRAARVDGLASIIADLEKAYPGLSFNRRDNNATTADVYFNNGGRYLTGSIDADGHLCIQRLSLNTADDARALFALMSGKRA
jgi:hypothetical protein